MVKDMSFLSSGQEYLVVKDGSAFEVGYLLCAMSLRLMNFIGRERTNAVCVIEIVFGRRCL